MEGRGEAFTLNGSDDYTRPIPAGQEQALAADTARGAAPATDSALWSDAKNRLAG